MSPHLPERNERIDNICAEPDPNLWAGEIKEWQIEQRDDGQPACPNGNHRHNDSHIRPPPRQERSRTRMAIATGWHLPSGWAQSSTKILRLAPTRQLHPGKSVDQVLRE